MDFFDYIEFLWSKRKRIALILFSNAVLIVVIALLLPNKYTSSAKIMPPAENSIGGALDRYSGIASMLGVNLGGSSKFGPAHFESIVKSRPLLEKIILRKYVTIKFPNKNVNLIDFFEIDGDSNEEKLELCMEYLRTNVITLLVNPENFITTLSATTREPKLSAEITKLALDELQKFNRKTIQKETLDKRTFLRKRLREISDSLRFEENGLVGFMNKVNDPTLPRIQVVLAKKQRGIEILSSILIELKKQAEILKLQEFSDLAPLKILEYPYPPALKSFPKRGMVSILYMIGIIIIIFAVYMMIFFRNKYHANSD